MIYVILTTTVFKQYIQMRNVLNNSKHPLKQTAVLKRLDLKYGCKNKVWV